MGRRVPETDAEASAVKEQDESYMDSPVLPEAEEPEEAEDSYAGVDFNEAMATMQSTARGLKEPASGENGTCNAGTVRASSQENGNAQERADPGRYTCAISLPGILNLLSRRLPKWHCKHPA